MDKKLIQNLYCSMVENDLEEYKKIFKSNIETDYIDYWKNAIQFYKTLDDKQKALFYTIIKQIMIDTISTVFGFLDGTSSIDEENYNIDILFNGTSIKGELQDAFLEYVEDIESQE